ncbi:N-acetylglucosamine kinase [Paenibacillus sp. MMS18-CY102]|uniref:N-acetylglucosamine kinase n=1 Tax=Paenibacillus sp. MMS18-CY102 TaxID=2682849 RepID=UPI001365472B|nr:BadF/BadG/BcrA/BcrD ATPase family protein [Paenibacillus sp. MMS18-CY102]MWC27814.1 ATPase [Paenibacillus sp. MMS18-CY102]
MTVYLGIDSGGSKTYALLTDAQGNIIGKGKGGRGNHQNGRDEAEFSIRAATAQALEQAGLTKEDVTHACFGLAGADRETDYQILRPLVASIDFPRWSIECDTLIGLRAGTTRPYGIGIICGTGTNCVGINPAGTPFQCGGFNYMYGDFGGGGALNVEAFRSVIRAWDGREQPTALTPLLLELLGYPDVEAMYNDYLDHDKAVPLDAAKLLFQAAAQNDAVAIAILNRQGVELGKSISAVVHKLGMSGDTFDVVLAGSLVTRGDTGGWIRGPIEQATLAAAPHAQVVTLATEPVVGAVWRAMETAGQPVSPDVHRKMSAYSEFNQLPEGI